MSIVTEADAAAFRTEQFGALHSRLKRSIALADEQ